jgi:hypothetical protein
VSQGVWSLRSASTINNLLMQLLRARDPARYNPQQNIRADVKLGGGVLVVPPQAASADEWERIRGAQSSRCRRSRRPELSQGEDRGRNR